MELKLDREEVEKALLAHANALMPNAGFNAAHVDMSYSTLRGVLFTREEPAKEEA